MSPQLQAAIDAAVAKAIGALVVEPAVPEGESGVTLAEALQRIMATSAGPSIVLPDGRIAYLAPDHKTPRVIGKIGADGHREVVEHP